jgi:hypothetical protein
MGPKLFQEAKADSAAAKLQAILSDVSAVVRDGQLVKVWRWQTGSIDLCQ